MNRLLAQGIEQNVFPGAAAAVAQGTGAARKTSIAAAGIMDRRDLSPVSRDTCFDLASLSKALSTALIFCSLFAEQTIHPDDTLAALLNADIPPDKRQITVRSLLSHSSGLAAYQPWFRDFPPAQRQENTAHLLRRILDEPLAYAPESRCLYSDLGFILLGHLAEQLTGRDLAANFRERTAFPLGLENDLFYIASPEETAAHRHRCAAAEDCAWRGRVMRAEAHDEHCWLMQGVAGHAGLFGTADGVLRLCGAILDQWQGAQAAPCGWAAFLRQGLERRRSGGAWRLGFDTPTAGASSSGRWFSPDSIGHLGFTGTSFWIDPEKELIAVLLTNRVHPSRENTKIREFRPYFHDRIADVR